jgi:para-nitrobenzyl esterase
MSAQSDDILNIASSRMARVEGGLLAGVPGADPALIVFRGVPFAAPPVGELRWRAPQPPAAWQGVRQADRFGPICPQHGPQPGSFYHQEFYLEPEPQSEDCLYLNIWTGARSSDERRPVMVWFHGGAFVEGSGSLPSFQGEMLAQKGAVLVTANYRLGVFGYFAHPALSAESERGVSGNYGLLDQVAALAWVRRNIAAFGGDPDNITIFGQSAGSMSVFTLAVSPLAQGLFRRVIGQSGSPFSFREARSLADAEQAGARMARGWGAATAAELRALPAATVQGERGAFSFADRPGLAIDGWAIPESPARRMVAGQQGAESLLVGATADEFTSMGSFGTQGAQAFRQEAAQRYGERAGEFLQLYPAGSDEQAQQARLRSQTDSLLAGMCAWANAQAAQRPHSAYLYYFDRRLPGRDSQHYGAFHSGDLYYAFGTLGSTNRPWEDADQALAEAMTSYWVRFAATGDPNGAGLPAWPTYDPDDPQAMRLGEQIGAMPLPNPEKTRFLIDEIGAWLAD